MGTVKVAALFLLGIFLVLSSFLILMIAALDIEAFLLLGGSVIGVHTIIIGAYMIIEREKRAELKKIDEYLKKLENLRKDGRIPENVYLRLKEEYESRIRAIRGS